MGSVEDAIPDPDTMSIEEVVVHKTAGFPVAWLGIDYPGRPEE